MAPPGLALPLAATLAFAIVLGLLQPGILETAVASISVSVAVVVSAVAAWRHSRWSRTPRPWRLIATGLAAFALGELYWTAADLTGRSLPAASAVDALYYAGYTFFLLALASFLPGQEDLRSRVRRAVDALALGAVLAAILWIGAIDHWADRHLVSEGTALVAGAYVALDLALAGAFFLLATDSRGATGRRQVLMGIGCLLWAVSDLVYARSAILGTYHTGSAFDAGWFGGYLFWAAAARRPAMGEVGPAPRLLPSRSSALLLYGPLALLLPLAAWDFLTTRRMDVVLFLLALAVVGLLGLRQVLLTTDLLRSGRGLLHQQSLFEETQAVGRIGSWEIDLAAQTYTCSPENSRLFGLTHASHHPLDAILANLHPDDRQPSMEAIEATIRDGKGELLQRILLPNGKLRYLRSRGELRRDAQGQPARVVGMSIDVTAQQEAAAALNASDERFRLASLATRDVIWDWDVARGRTQYSEAMKLTFGHDPKDLAGPGAFGRLVNSEDVVKYGESAARLMSGDVDSFVGEYRFRHADGTWRDVLDRARIVKDAQGRVVRIVGAMQDVTEQKRREALLSQAQSIAAMASWEADLLTGRVQWSPEAFRLFDLEPGTPMTYESWLGRIHPEDRERAKAAADGVVAKGQPAEFVCRIVRRDGSIRHTFNKTIPTLADGKVVRLTGINQDITEKHEAEARAAEVRRLQEVTAFKTQFLNTAAHELATPLTPIKLQMASLRRSIFGELTPRQLEAIGLLDRNLVRLDLLVQDLLDAARLQGGKMRLTKKPMAVAPVVRDVLQSFAEKARQDGIHLSGRGLEQSIEVDGDEARLTQVLVNLVSNAFKFTPRGGHVEVSSSRDGAEAVLAVRDTGLGLEPDQIARLFQPFTQVHDQAKHNLGGTGLGLYISHGIMAQLGGTLACRSDGRGKGATFEVRLPLRVATAGRPSGAAAATPA